MTSGGTRSGDKVLALLGEASEVAKVILELGLAFKLPAPGGLQDGGVEGIRPMFRVPFALLSGPRAPNIRLGL